MNQLSRHSFSEVRFKCLFNCFVFLLFCSDVQRLSSLYDATKSKLMENETHSQVPQLLYITFVTYLNLNLQWSLFSVLPSQLGNLERKWQHHEQNNFVMKECILLTAKYGYLFLVLPFISCVWPFKSKLLSSTFMWYCLLRCGSNF